ncbi:MAG: hypothetical protein ACM3Q2_18635, partial [Syntrophothermus sp.]
MKTAYICLASLFLISFVFLDSLYGQDTLTAARSEDPEYFLGLSIGITDMHKYDPYLLPDTYSGALFSSAIFFRVNAGVNIHEADFRFSTGSPGSLMKLQVLNEKTGSVSYSFLHTINSWETGSYNSRLLLGAGLSSFVMNTDVITSTNVSSVKSTDQSWYWSHSFNVLLEFELAASGHRSVLARIILPVISNISRPENGHWLNERNSKVIMNSFLNAAKGGRPEYLWNNFAIAGGLEYRQSVNKYLDLL